MRKIEKLTMMLATVIPCLFGCKHNKDSFKYIGPIAPFLHEVIYDDYTFDEKRTTIQEYTGSCSVVRNGNFIGRNFDYFYNNVPVFLVKVNAKKNRYASIGISQVPLFKEEELLSNRFNKDLFKLIPNVMMDGINEKGVFICNNVVSNEGIVNQGTDPTKEEMGVWFITRKVLDHASNVDEAVNIMRSYNIVGDLFGIENLHFMICDSIKTCVVEIIGNKLVVEEKKNDEQIMTNFLCNQDLPMDCHPSGIERYNILKANYEMGSSFEGMQNLLFKVRFSQSFNPNMDPVWISDAGIFSYQQMQDPEIISSYKTELETELYAQFINDFSNNIRTDNIDDAWWITVHNSTYDIENRSLKIYVQENYEHCFEFKI